MLIGGENIKLSLGGCFFGAPCIYIYFMQFLIHHTFFFLTISAYPECIYLLVSPVSLYLLLAPPESVSAINRLILSIHVQHISFSASSYLSRNVILYASCLALPYMLSYL